MALEENETPKVAAYTADDAYSSDQKESPDNNGDLEHAATRATFLQPEEIENLSEAHREYLLQRHGTLDLDPVPAFGDADPYNWPTWKKVVNLVLVAFHACMATFIAAAIIPAYENIAEELGVTIQKASYLTSLQILILGVAPLLWRPISTRFGRRPIFLLSLVGACVFNVACGYCKTYGSMAACRALTALFICPASAIGSAVVTECFFRNQRAKFMGIWTLMVTLGVPLSPFLFGFVAVRVGWRWIYFILAITNGVQFILYFFLGPETRYIRKGVEHEGSSRKQEFYSLRRIDPTPFRALDFISPLGFFAYATVLVPAAAYAMVFLFTSVMVTVEIPQLFAEKFHFNPQSLGLQFLGIVIGSLIGEQLGGWASDYWMKRKRRAMGGLAPTPEWRLWLSYLGYVLAIVGTVVFLVQLENAPDGHWNITPIVGAAIGAVGNQIITTVLVTYAVDSHPQESSSVGVFITFVRQVWGFIGPFWFPQMFEDLGLKISAVVASVLIIGISLIPTLLLQVLRRGQKTA